MGNSADVIACSNLQNNNVKAAKGSFRKGNTQHAIHRQYNFQSWGLSIQCQKENKIESPQHSYWQEMIWEAESCFHRILIFKIRMQSECRLYHWRLKPDVSGNQWIFCLTWKVIVKIIHRIHLIWQNNTLQWNWDNTKSADSYYWPSISEISFYLYSLLSCCLSLPLFKH